MPFMPVCFFATENVLLTESGPLPLHYPSMMMLPMISQQRLPEILCVCWCMLE